MKIKTREILSSVVLILASGAGLILSRSIEKPFREYDPGAAFLPRTVLVLIIALCALKIVVTVLENSSRTLEPADRSQWSRGILTILLVGLYCRFYGPLGFLADTAIYLFLQILVVTPKEKRNLWRILMIDLVATVLIYLIFAKGFQLRLPAGLFSF